MYSQAFAIEPFHKPFSASLSAVAAEAGPKVIVMDVSGRLIEATNCARALLADGMVLQCSFDRVSARTRADGARLTTAIAKARCYGHAHTLLEGSAFEGQAAQRLAADLVTVGPDGAEGAHIVMILKPALEERRQRLCAAERSFGLTRAEGRLLAALFEGCSVPEAADRLGVARSTARTHLQRVFDKTGVRRQGDLVRLVGCA